jgi:protein O-mannosyl-transferase
MRRWLAPASVVLLAIVVNLNILQNGFVYDDGEQILHNRWLRDGAIGQIFSHHVWGFEGPISASNYYRPLMHLINLICYRLFGFEAWGYHLTSLLFHAGCTLLVLLIARKIGLSETLAFWAALLFSMHPIHTESVAWIAANTELVYTFFVLLGFFWHVGGHRRWSPAALLAALFMKETAVVLIPMVAAWQWYETRETPRRERLIALGHVIGPYLYPLAVYVPMRLYALDGLTMAARWPTLGPDDQFYSTFAMLGKYLWKFFDPLPFNIFYVFHEVTSPADPRFLGGLAAVLATIGLGWLLWRRGSRLWLAVFVILVPLFPVLWIQRIGENAFTERYLYLPSVGFCWLVAALLDRAPRTIANAPVAAILGGLLLTWYATTTVLRNYDWHDNFVLYERTLVVSPESALIRANLADAYLLGGAPERALPLFRKAARDRPLETDYVLKIGTTLARLGRLAEARRIIEGNRRLDPKSAQTWVNLGVISEMEGKSEEAELEYRSALKIAPDNADAHQDLGALLAQRGKFAEAEMHFRITASVGSLGKLLVAIGRLSDAEPVLRRAANDDVTNAEALYLLGNILRGEGREREAQVAFHEMRAKLPYTTWRPPPGSAGIPATVSLP